MIAERFLASTRPSTTPTKTKASPAAEVNAHVKRLVANTVYHESKHVTKKEMLSVRTGTPPGHHKQRSTTASTSYSDIQNRSATPAKPLNGRRSPMTGRGHSNVKASSSSRSLSPSSTGPGSNSSVGTPRSRASWKKKREERTTSPTTVATTSSSPASSDIDPMSKNEVLSSQPAEEPTAILLVTAEEETPVIQLESAQKPRAERASELVIETEESSDQSSASATHPHLIESSTLSPSSPYFVKSSVASSAVKEPLIYSHYDKNRIFIAVYEADILHTYYVEQDSYNSLIRVVDIQTFDTSASSSSSSVAVDKSTATADSEPEPVIVDPKVVSAIVTSSEQVVAPATTPEPKVDSATQPLVYGHYDQQHLFIAVYEDDILHTYYLETDSYSSLIRVFDMRSFDITHLLLPSPVQASSSSAEAILNKATAIVVEPEFVSAASESAYVSKQVKEPLVYCHYDQTHLFIAVYEGNILFTYYLEKDAYSSLIRSVEIQSFDSLSSNWISSAQQVASKGNVISVDVALSYG
jgi:hypothetical protein